MVFATETALTITMALTEMSMPPVTMMTVIPIAMMPIGARRPRSGWIEFGERNPGVATARMTHSRARRPMRIHS